MSEHTAGWDELGFLRSLREPGSQHRLHGKLRSSFESHREPSHGLWGWIHRARLALGAAGGTNPGGWQLRTDGTARIPACREGSSAGEGRAGWFLSRGVRGSPGVRSPSPVWLGSRWAWRG